MQQPVRSILHNHTGTSCLVTVGVALILVLLSVAGCAPPPPPPEQPKPFDKQALTLSCPEPAMADAITPMVRTWEARTGAAVTIRREPMTAADATDIAVVAAGDLGAWAEPGHLAPVPAKLRSDATFQWSGLLPAYGERLVEWGGQTMAIPLTGDGHIVVYRADRFAEKTAIDACQARYKHGLAPPATWEEFADVAEVFAVLDKKPSLPPLPTDPERLFDLLSRVASSADRPALSDLELAARAGQDREALAFQFALATGKPRLRGSGFQLAADWVARLRTANTLPAPGGADDPVAALSEGRAVIAVLSLDQLARLPREGGAVPARFGLAGVPGTRIVFGTQPNPELPANFVPHFSGGRLGVVRTRCPHKEAAFDLLADLGSPARGAEFVATPGLGAGPTRVVHVDRERLLLWLGYGFDEDRSKFLQDAMRHYADQTVKNPTFGLRGPDRAELIKAAAPAVSAIGTGGVTAVDRLKQVEDAWQALDAKVSEDVLRRWRQRAAGLH